MKQIAVIVFALLAGIGIGSVVQSVRDTHAVLDARRDELQANSLEDECKSHLGTVTLLPDGGWKLEHVPMPVCPDNLKRTVDIPERDEVDALTVNCGGK